VLIREKQVYYGHTGTGNLFIKQDGEFFRVTPGKARTEGDDLSETSYINSSIYDHNLKVSVCKQPFSPDTDDFVFICSDAYVRESDTEITQIVNQEKNIENIGIDLTTHALKKTKNSTQLSFTLVRFNIRGGKYTLAGSFEYLYANFLGKLISAITSTPALIILALVTIWLLYYVLN